MQQLAAVPGRALTYAPREALGWEDADAVACCGAAQCLGLCYVCDVLGTVGAMQALEEGRNKRSLPLFAFYEACWPCMRVFACCWGAPAARQLPRVYVPYLQQNTFDADDAEDQS
jgi:hypothetical protein